MVMTLTGAGAYRAAAAGLSLDFTTGSLPGAVTFTRASSGTRLNVSGVLVSETTDVARLDYNAAHTSLGLLYEPSATNLDVRSQEADNAAWSITNVTLTADAVAAPDGTTTADQMVEAALTGEHILYNNLASQTNASWSVFVKANTRSAVGLRFYNAGSDYCYAIFDLSGVAVSQQATAGATFSGRTATITDFGGGWYRCTLSASRASGTTYYAIDICTTTTPTVDANGAQSYAGDVTKNLYVWGMQLEATLTPTAYIATTSAAVTRAADNASFTIPGGITNLLYTFDDNTTQSVGVSSGAYTIPTNLNRARIKTIVGS